MEARRDHGDRSMAARPKVGKQLAHQNIPGLSWMSLRLVVETIDHFWVIEMLRLMTIGLSRRGHVHATACKHHQRHPKVPQPMRHRLCHASKLHMLAFHGTGKGAFMGLNGGAGRFHSARFCSSIRDPAGCARRGGGISYQDWTESSGSRKGADPR